MTVEADIQAIFALHAAVTALVGDKIYPDALPADKLPAVVHTVTGSQTEQGLSGEIFAEAHQVRVECWAKTKSGAVALREACKGALLAADVPYESGAPLVDAPTGEFGAAIDFTWWAL